jgi:uncharacterized repeat protein (TIGR02543 family)
MGHPRTARTGTAAALRRALACLLAAVLTLSLGGIAPAYGTEADVATGDKTAGVAPQAVTASGNCGPEGNESDVTWSLEDGTLTISGTGDMGDYGTSPWNYDYCDEIKHVSISEGVASVGSSAFSRCEFLESVSMASSVASVGDGAFYGCHSLISVSIPSSVASIGDDAFLWCTSLSSVVIAEGVLQIGNRAFSQCTSLVSVSIPSTVTSVEDGAFSKCTPLTSITVAAGNAGYASDDGILFNKGKTALIQYPAGKTASSYGVPDSVVAIGAAAFSGCGFLESVSIPEGVASIGDYAFDDCAFLASVALPSSVASIGERAFQYCVSLKSVSIPEGVPSIGDYTFDNCASLTSVSIPASVLTIGHGAFFNCYSLKSVAIPASVKSIGSSAFQECRALTSIVVPHSVLSIGDKAFYQCTSLVSVSISEGVESIGASTFEYCTALASIGIPASVESIGERAFFTCHALSSITVADTNRHYSSSGGVLFDKGKTTLIRYPEGKTASSYAIPTGVLTIGDSAFSACYSLVSVTIPASVTTIEGQAFVACLGLASVFVPASVTSIEAWAFDGCSATLYCEAPSEPAGWEEGWDAGYDGLVRWGQSGLPAPVDTAPPVLGAASAARRSASAATVTLTSSEAGALYWAVVASGAPVPAIGTAGAGAPLVAGAQALEVAGLATGAAWDVCVVATDAAGNLSAVLRVGVPAWAYTVTFKGWDGRAIGAAQKVAHGSFATAPAAPPRTGHTFAGWDRGFASVTADLTVTARYTANAYTVRLDANGGKLAAKAASLKKTYGQAVGKLTAKPARSGYTFLGWYTGKAGGSKVAAAAKVTKPVTYYAHWKANGPVVTLNAAGGKVGKAATASVVKAKGAAVGRLATPTYVGHAFLGWYTAKKGGTKVTAKTRVSKNVTYYAHWAKVHIVKLNASGGKVGGKASASLKRAHDSKLGKLATPKRTGYTFQGWYTAKSGGKKVTSATKATKNVTLYAHWKRVR